MLAVENVWELMRNVENQNKIASELKSKVSEQSVVNTILCLTGLRREPNEITKRIVWLGCRELVSIAQDVLSKLSQSVSKCFFFWWLKIASFQNHTLVDVTTQAIFT